MVLDQTYLDKWLLQMVTYLICNWWVDIQKYLISKVRQWQEMLLSLRSNSQTITKGHLLICDGGFDT